MNKAIFLDRDGTINIEKHYLYRIEDFEFLPGAKDALKELQRKGYLLIVITNQSGIARGFYTEDDYNRLNRWMVKTLDDEGIRITKTYFCPHLPDAAVEEYRTECKCRKPKLGLFEQAIKDYDIDLNRSFSVGDKIRDCSICLQSPCRGFLIGQNEQEEVINSVKRGEVSQVKYCTDLLTAAMLIPE